MTRVLRIKHVIPSVADVASGPTYSVQSLCKELSLLGSEVELLTTRVSPSANLFLAKSFSRKYFSKKRLAFSPELYRYLRNSEYDVLHNHSLWMMPNVYPGIVAKKLRKKLITSPRGTFSDWAISRNRFAKKLMWILGQRLSISFACCVHATSFQEFQDLRRRGVNKPMCIIPNGYDCPADIAVKPKGGELKRFLYLGRLHPIKGLENILTAWKSIQDVLTNWEIRFVGPGDEGYLKKLSDQIQRDAIKRITIRDQVEGDDKSKEYLEASAYILASYSENFAMTVVEALGHGLPCIVSKGAPWEEVETNRCGKWVSNAPESLSNAMMNLGMLKSEELEAMGLRGRAFVESSFTWNRIATQMMDVYKWIYGGMTDSAPITVIST
jgi:glycosyltransferase involved in cell wall biosynthesis